MSYYLADGGHVLISGSTGAKDGYGGKTVLANWWSSNLVDRGHRDLAVFVNPKRHSFLEGRTVSSLKGMAEAYRAGARVLDYQGGRVDDVVRFLKELPGEKVAVFDEAQDYGDFEGLDWVLSQGGNLDSGSIRGLVVTQRPWNLGEQLRANMPVKVWVGPVTNEGKSFFQSEQMETVARELSGEIEAYHWAVTDAGELQEVNGPVPEAYA